MAASSIRLFSGVRHLSWQRFSHCRSIVNQTVSHGLFQSSIHTMMVSSSVISLSRLYSVTSNSSNSKEDIRQEVEENQHKPQENFMKRFFHWWNNNYVRGEEETRKKHVGKDEIRKREELLRRLQKMYYAKPPVYPDLVFYKELFETFIAYNDRFAVETIWRIMGEMGVEPDNELKAQVELFLKKVHENS